MEPKKISRYVRRDSRKNNLEQISHNISRNNKTKENTKDNNAKNNLGRKQLSSYILRTDYIENKKRIITPFHKSPSQITVSSFSKRENLSHKFSKANSGYINQPRTPLVSYFSNKNNDIFGKSIKRNIKTPQISTNNDFIKVNNLTYYLRCPYCNHTLNKIPNKDIIEKKHYTQYSLENKENMNENMPYSNIAKTEKKPRNILREDKSNHKSFYINKNGVIVFSQNDQPTSSIQIVNSKPDLSKYINESKVFGKKRNIGIYEGPVPITKVFVRPIKI